MTEIQTANEAYLAALEQYNEAAEQAKRTKEALDYAEHRMIAAMNEAGVESFRGENGVTFSTKREYYYRAPAETRPQLLNVLEADGYRDVFTVTPGTLNKLMNELVEENDGAIPARYLPYVNESDVAKLSVRGAKNRK